MVLRFLSDIAVREQLGKEMDRVRLKSIARLQNWKIKSKNIIVVLNCKKKLFLRKLTKISNLILCFSEIPEILICFGVKHVAFLSED